jgi:hypothetical protein
MTVMSAIPVVQFAVVIPIVVPVVITIMFVLTFVLVMAVTVALPVISIMVLVCESGIRPQTQEHSNCEVEPFVRKHEFS